LTLQVGVLCSNDGEHPQARPHLLELARLPMIAQISAFLFKNGFFKLPQLQKKSSVHIYLTLKKNEKQRAKREAPLRIEL